VRVLVTGARGMLGREVARRLAARGDTVTVLQRGVSGLAGPRAGIPEVIAEVRADLADAGAIRRAVEGQDAVVHLAARVGVTGAWPDFERANIAGTRSVVDACRLHGVGRLVHVSTPSVAHAGSSLVGAPATPADPDRARGHYARSKAVAEQIALAAADHLPVVAIRPHLVWGPGDTQLVARMVQRARAGRLPVIGSGAALVDTTYVGNAADALVAALDHCDAARGRTLVVSNGEPRPIAELIGDICVAAGSSPPSRHVPVVLATAAGAVVEALWSNRARVDRSADEPPITRFVAEQLSTAHWFDQRETRRVLRWQPATSIDDGLAELTRWYVEHPDR